MSNVRLNNTGQNVSGRSMPFVPPGRFPAKFASVCSDVLARFLKHERLTSLDAVNDASTTRLSAVVHYLVHKYGWSITVQAKAVGCRDGRVAWIAEYSLPTNTIFHAIANGADIWCAKVHVARSALRTRVAEAENAAINANASRKHCPHPGQGSLFCGEGGEV